MTINQDGYQAQLQQVLPEMTMVFCSEAEKLLDLLKEKDQAL